MLFSRGDASSLLFGLDAEGKITSVAIVSMAGDWTETPELCSAWQVRAR